MELWIRSQDKERLTKATDIRLGYLKETGWFIEDCDELGRYKTKERALEVLNEIQDIVRLKQAWQLDENSFQICIKKGGYDEEQVVALMNMMYVYEMPSE